MSNNPLLSPFETPPFDKIHNEHFFPAFESAMAAHREEIERIVSNPAPPDFSNPVEALERSGRQLDEVSSIFFNLRGAESNEEIQRIARKVSPLLSEHANSIATNEVLFQKVATVYGQREKLELTPEQDTLLTKQYRSFTRNGALLDRADKQKLKEIDRQLSELGLAFGDNLLADSNDYALILESEKDLAGLPENIVEAARLTAEERGKEGKWVFTLDYPSYGPFMTYADNRSLRETLYRAMGRRGCRNNQWDNQKIVKNIAQLRKERAKLLGYTTHAHFVLEERMAENPEKVNAFLEELLDAARPAATRELEELKTFARENGFEGELQQWDASYWGEKLKKSHFDLDDETLRPYFKLDNAIKGVFQTAHKLYGINFCEQKDIPVYHPEVRAYRVTDSKEKPIGIFYTDLFPRPGKRNGAWATTFRNQCKIDGRNQEPTVSIVCNFTRPTTSRPSLLNFREVTTLFHEFGHSLHMLLSDCHYSSLSGAGVYWDFVELPSQIMENWPLQQECLDLFATHFESGETIPPEMVKKIAASANFMEGTATMRQVGLALLDMFWHWKQAEPKTVEDIFQFEEEIMAPLRLLPSLKDQATSPSFGHIFSGGYSAGYYSYKWAEVLDADAFELFVEKGIFDRQVAHKFQSEILRKGGGEHPMTLYRRFRGRPPGVEALLKRAGLLQVG